MTADLGALYATALTLGFVHTVCGPDHYLPFVAMSRVGRWSLRKTISITLLCGVGHVGSSVVLGTVGVAFGLMLFKLERVEEIRGGIVPWLLIAFGWTYFVWGVVQAIRNRPHTHPHLHLDGTVHSHEHVHQAEHVHAHDAGTLSAPAVPLTGFTAAGTGAQMPALASVDSAGENPYRAPSGSGTPTTQPSMPAALRRKSATTGTTRPSLTPWVLFTIFIFGPCEPLIPVLMYPAAKADPLAIVIVTALFGLATLATMTGMVVFLRAGAAAMPFRWLDRYNHALAGAIVLSCGIAIKLGL